MYRSIYSFLLLLFIALASSAQGVRAVVIDPGHGGKDPGCVYGSLYEKDINLDVALMLGEMIKRDMPAVRVVFTRTTDVKVALADRGKIANEAKADIFISIHVNATERNVKAPSGALTLIMGKDNEGRNLDMARKENDVISFEDDYTTTYKEYLSGSSEMFIIYSLMQYVNIDKSIHFANSVQRHFKQSTPLPDLGIRRQKLLVLWYTTMPGVLVELGFINNDHDRQALSSTEGKRKMAEAILGGIKEFRTGSMGVGEIPATEQPASASAVKPAKKPASSSEQKPAAEKKTPERKPIVAGEYIVKPEEIKPEEIKPEEKPAATSAQKPKPLPAGEVFVIQILSTSRKVPATAPELKGMKPIERFSEGRYRYFTGKYATRAEAEQELTKVRLTFKDAFITTIKL